MSRNASLPDTMPASGARWTAAVVLSALLALFGSNLPAVAADTGTEPSATVKAAVPPAKGFRCEYVARQVSVKARYSLWVTQAEHDAIAGILATCPGQQAPATVAAASSATVVYYANCSEAVAAGAAPLYAGSPGYRSGLDGDGDGVACEG
ncbi:excalibur calcium-binding domain-containing protein [Pseudarthrobacter sp. 902506025]|uniref:excalibur calcium-binding domain-containing protein n=1 Tax=Pseudarthrobacter sp. 902506025 TaxID=3155291 RepID=UPI003CC82E2D